MQCIACEYFSARVIVSYNGTIVCESIGGTINLGQVILPIRCDRKLESHEGQLVKVEAYGSVTPAGGRPIKSYDKKILNLIFINKK